MRPDRRLALDQLWQDISAAKRQPAVEPPSEPAKGVEVDWHDEAEFARLRKERIEGLKDALKASFDAAPPSPPSEEPYRPLDEMAMLRILGVMDRQRYTFSSGVGSSIPPQRVDKFAPITVFNEHGRPVQVEVDRKSEHHLFNPGNGDHMGLAFEFKPSERDVLLTVPEHYVEPLVDELRRVRWAPGRPTKILTPEQADAEASEGSQ